MKKILSINILMLTSMLPIFGQTVWNELPLVGAEAKIIPNVRQPRFSVAFTGSLPFGDAASQNLEIAVLQNAAFSPGTAEQLFEKLGAPFFIGNPSSQKLQNVEMTGKTKLLSGLRLGVRLGNRFEIRTCAQHFKSEWSSGFPVFVAPHSQQEPTLPKNLTGNVNTSASGMLLDIETMFLVANGRFQPYLKGGARGLFFLKNESHAELAGVLLPLKIEKASSGFSPFAGAGLRWLFLKNVFLEAGCSFGKLPGGQYQMAAEASAGWKF